MICDGCTDHGDFFHRCRADENACIDGKDCPDYIERCDCTYCNYAGDNVIETEESQNDYPSRANDCDSRY